MSKSLGNSPEPLELISRYGADAVRVGMLLCSPAGNDLLYDEGLIEQGRNFCNKIWNAMRLVKGWQVDPELPQPEVNKISIQWFDSVYNASLRNINDLFDDYRLSEALMAAYKLVWDDFCSWFLEMIKPAYQQPVDQFTYQSAIEFFEKLLLALHPFMPFLTEEIWTILKERESGSSLMVEQQPEASPYNQRLIDRFSFAETVIIAIRSARKEKNIPQKEGLQLYVRKNNEEQPDLLFDGVISKLCNLSQLAYVEEKLANCHTFIVGSTEFFIPLQSSIDAEGEIQKLEEELAYTRGFLEKVMQKLDNEKFVRNAPAAVVDGERKKQQDAEARIRVLEEQLTSYRI